MNTHTAQSFIGKQALLSVDGLKVPVVITDHRYVFGRDDYKVSPVGGTGEKWVSSDKVTVNKN